MLYIMKLKKLPGKKAGSVECPFLSPKCTKTYLRMPVISKHFPRVITPSPARSGRVRDRKGGEKRRERSRRGEKGEKGENG
jgi:hypothetical protein